MENITIQVLMLCISLTVIAFIPAVIAWYLHRDKAETIFIAAMPVVIGVVLSPFIKSFLQRFYESNSFQWFIGKIGILHPSFISTWEIFSTIILLFIVAITAWVSLVISAYLKGDDNRIRGANILSRAELNKELKQFSRAEIPIQIGHVKIPLEKETIPSLIVGNTGVGKSQCIASMAQAVRKKGNKAALIDPGGDLFSKMGCSGDILINMNDKRSKSWGVLSEVRCDADFLMLTVLLVLKKTGQAEEFLQYGRIILEAVLGYCWHNNKRRNIDILRQLSLKNREKLGLLVKGTDAEEYFTPENIRYLGSILGVLKEALSWMKRLDPNANDKSFSFRRYAEEVRSNSWLWFTYKDADMEYCTPLVRVGSTLIINSVLSLKPDNNRRLWLFLDELASNGKIEPLSKAINRGRKYGLSLVMGCQSLAQIHQIYGKDEAQTIIGGVGNLLIFRTPDADTSEWFSRAIGDTERRRKQVNQDGNGNVISFSWIVERVPSVLPSEIMQLKNLTAYLKVSDIGWAFVGIPAILHKLPNLFKAFVPKDDAKQLVGKSAASVKTPKKPAKPASQQRKPAQKLVTKSANNKPLDEV